MPAKAIKRKATGSRKRSPSKREGKQPIASRPLMPAIYGTAKSAKGLLDWEWARQRLNDSHNYVIVTVRPDGRPHAMGMHGLWFGDEFYFGTADSTRKAKNLAVNANCIVINEKLDELVIVEGTATKVGYDQLPQGLSDASKKKYGWPLDPRKGSSVFKIAPKTVFALPEKQFGTALTRWRFE